MASINNGDEDYVRATREDLEAQIVVLREEVYRVNAEKDQAVADKDQEIDQVNAEKDQANADKEEAIAGKDEEIAEKERIIVEKQRIIAEKQRIIDAGIKEHGDWEARKARRSTQWWVDLEDGVSTEFAARKCAIVSNYSYRVTRPGLQFINEEDGEVPSEEVDYNPKKRFKKKKKAFIPFRLMDLFVRSKRTSGMPRLPLTYLAQILCEVLVKGSIDVLSRFDEHAARPWKEPVGSISRLPHRFFWGQGGYCSINGAYDPGLVLAPLLVSRLWLELGGAIFYGMNIFRFSSLGEMGRFLKGIGKPRKERIQKLELTWIGSLMYKTDGSSTRSLPLMHLSDCINLKSIRIFIDEGRHQRKNESKRRAAILREATAGEVKDFNKRALPTLQGLVELRDCIRGLKLIEFYDYSSESWQRKIKVQDQEFVEHVRALVTRPKPEMEARRAAAPNLRRMISPANHFAGWQRELINITLEKCLEWLPGADDEDSDDEDSDDDYGEESDSEDDDDSQSDEAREEDNHGAVAGRRFIELSDDEEEEEDDVEPKHEVIDLEMDDVAEGFATPGTDDDSDEDEDAMFVSQKGTARRSVIPDSYEQSSVEDSEDEDSVMSDVHQDNMTQTPITPAAKESAKDDDVEMGDE